MASVERYGGRLRTLGLLFVAMGCREPTQVKLELSTDAFCQDVRETSITVATLDTLVTAFPDTTTTKCDPITKRIGSLTLVPTGGDSEEFAVRVVTGLGLSSETCVAEGFQSSGSGGCIVARRALHFIPERTLHVPIELEVICAGIPCEATETCRHGKCVDATIADVRECLKAEGCDVLSDGITSGSGGSSPIGGTGGVSVSGGGGTGSVSVSGGGGTGSVSVSGGGGTGSVSVLGGGGTGSVSVLGGGGLGGEVILDGGGTGGEGIPGGGGLGGEVVLEGGGTGGVSVLGGGGTGGLSVSGGGGTGGLSVSGGGGTGGTVAVLPVCGDKVTSILSGELCDTGGDTVTCNGNCWPPQCGDGYLNRAAGEVCDGSLGAQPCNPSCRLSTCGDGYVDYAQGETCESGQVSCTNCHQDVPITTGSVWVESIRSNELIFENITVDLDIHNQGPALPISGLSLNYYYHADSSNKQQVTCSYADTGCGNLVTSVTPLDRPCSNATHLVTVRFTVASSLAQNSTLGVVARVSDGLLAWQDFSNDYSRAQNALSYTRATNVTLTRNGVLLWGIPPCGCGNGVLESGEECDHGGGSASCKANCTKSTCGDSFVNALAGETCDEGAPSLSCGADCKSTGFPASAASATVLWLDATASDTLVKSTQIGTWKDRSGKGNHLSQVDGLRQPLWVSAAIGGKNAVYFDGSNDELMAAAPVLNQEVGSAIVVHRVEPYGFEATLLGNGWSSSGGGLAIRTRPQLDGLGLSFAATTGYANTLWSLGARTGSGPPTSGATYWGWNSTQVTSVRSATEETYPITSSFRATSDRLRLGGVAASEPYRGYLGEVMLFNRELTTAERKAILTQLSAKWSLP